MYCEYVAERLGKSYFEIKDKGFCIYEDIESEDAIYIEEIFVKPEYRQKEIGTELMLRVDEIRREMGRKL